MTRRCIPTRFADFGKGISHQPGDNSGRDSTVEESRIGLILMLLREGSMRHAIRVYQEEADVSFWTAKQSVHELAQQHGIEVRRSSLLPLALLALASLLGLALSH